ncbi:MAG: hypothetical protein RSD85_03300 [Erysipelotrichaceae bacterium]
MKKISSIILIAILFLVSGCTKAGIEVKTELNINKDNSGTRIMNFSVDKNTFGSGIGPQNEDFNNLIKMNIPKELEYSLVETNSSYDYSIVMKFKSLEEYKAKVTKIIGKEAIINIKQADSVFASGISINENFTSTDLTQWLIKLLEDKKILKNTDLTYDKNSVIIAGKEIDTNAQINVVNLTYTPLEYINFDTIINEDDSYNREISFVMSKASYELKTQELKEHMSKITPKEALGTWTNDSNNYTYKVSFKAIDINQLKLYTTQIMSSDNNKIKHDIFVGADPLKIYQSFEETINPSNYVVPTDDKLLIKYSIKANETTNMYILNYNGEETQLDNIHSYNNEDKTDLYAIKINSFKPYKINNIEYSTEILNDTELRKTLAFNVDGKGKEGLANYFNSYKLNNLKTNIQENTLNIIIEGPIKDVNTTITKLLGEGNNITYNITDSNILKASTNYKETINLDTLIKNLEYKGNIKYTINGNENELFNNIKMNDKEGFAFGSKTIETNTKVVISYEGTKLFIITIIKVLACIGLILFVMLCVATYYINHKADEYGQDFTNNKEALKFTLGLLKTKIINSFNEFINKFKKPKISDDDKDNDSNIE